MPELDLFLLDLYYLFKLFPQKDEDLNRQIAEYEIQTNEDMAQIRINLFGSDYENSQKAFI